MPSYTSNSEVPYRSTPDRKWSLIMAVAVIVYLIGMTGWELKARSMQHEPGTYSEEASFVTMWAEERRKLDMQGHEIKLILLGSSRILWATDIDIMEQQFGTRPIQMAIPGTSPALMFKDIVENTDFDGLILLGVTPFLFNRLNGGAFGGEAMDWYEGVGPSRRTGHEIEVFLSGYFGFLDDGFRLFELLDHYNNFTDREGAIALSENGWKLGNGYADRQQDMWAPVEVEGSFDNTQITNFWMKGLRRPPETPEKMAEMVTKTNEFFVPLIKEFNSRGGDVVFIRMPGSGLYEAHDIKTNYHELAWDPMMDAFGVPAINCMDYPQLSTDLEIPEWSHLSRKSQDEWSRIIVPFIETAYQDMRGRSIYELMEIEAPLRQ